VTVKIDTEMGLAVIPQLLRLD